VHHPVQHGGVDAVPERRPPGRGEHHQRTEGEHVRGGGQFPAAHVLGRHELRRVMADYPFGTGHVVGSQPRHRIRDLCAQKVTTSQRVDPQARPWPEGELVHFE
jgi:hypothetical protein